MAKLTLIGLYNYDPTLFANLSVPTGIDADVLRDTILLRGGEFEVLYPDITFLKNAIGTWSDKWMHTMERWVNVMNSEYNPIENYDRKENWTDVNQRNSSTSRTESATGKDNSVSSGNGSTENTRSAFDSSTYQPHDKSTSASNGINTSKSETTAAGNTTDASNELLQKSGRAHGNIGVMSTQDMVKQELDLYYWNLYEEIADLFISELCIFVY